MPHSTLPHYRAPLQLGRDPVVSMANFDAAFDAYENKNYRHALLHLLDFMNPALLEGQDTEQDLEISHPHGSAKVVIRVTADEFRISAPFVRINGANKVPLMRRVAEINFNTLNLVQIALKDEVLWFDYKTPLELCQPMKIYGVIRELCIYCDDLDDEFIEKYGASFYHEPEVTPLPSTDQDQAWEHFQAMGEQHQRFYQYFREQRWLGAQWDMLNVTLFSLMNVPYIHGVMRTDVEEALAKLYDNYVDGNHRVDQAAGFLDQLFTKTSKEAFLKNVYAAKVLLSLRRQSSVEILQNAFVESKREVDEQLEQGNGFGMAYSMLTFLHRTLQTYNLDEGHRVAITRTLEKVGGMEIKKAIPVMQALYVDFINGDVSVEAPRERKGLLSRLFGKG